MFFFPLSKPLRKVPRFFFFLPRNRNAGMAWSKPRHRGGEALLRLFSTSERTPTPPFPSDQLPFSNFKSAPIKMIHTPFDLLFFTHTHRPWTAGVNTLFLPLLPVVFLSRSFNPPPCARRNSRRQREKRKSPQIVFLELDSSALFIPSLFFCLLPPRFADTHERWDVGILQQRPKAAAALQVRGLLCVKSLFFSSS